MISYKYISLVYSHKVNIRLQMNGVVTKRVDQVDAAMLDIYWFNNSW